MSDRPKRYAARVPVSVSSAPRGQRAAVSANLSRDGICLESPTSLTPGSEIRGYILLDDTELEWVGRVVWIEPAEPVTHDWHRHGVRFTELSKDLHALLSAHLN